MATRQKRIPDLFARRALKNRKDGVDQVENGNGRHAQINPNIRGHISLAVGDEDTKILKENREFDENDRYAIADTCDVDVLD